MAKAPRRVASAATLAKFSRPRLYNVQKRERLFRRLDAGDPDILQSVLAFGTG